MKLKPVTTGVLTFAYGAAYQRLAYAQALTLLPLGIPITVVVPNKVLDYPKLSDVAQIEVLTAKTAKFEWEAFSYDVSPYDVTIKTDADVLFPAAYLFDIQHCFSCIKTFGVVSGLSCNLDTTVVDCPWYRKAELSMDWPSFYSALCGFTKDDGKPFFDYTKRLFADWWKLSALVGDLTATTDSVLSLAYRDVFGFNVIPTGLNFIHAKQGICGSVFHDKWVNDVPHHLTDDGAFCVNGRNLSLPFHYFDKQFVSEAILKRLENVLR